MCNKYGTKRLVVWKISRKITFQTTNNGSLLVPLKLIMKDLFKCRQIDKEREREEETKTQGN